MQINQNNNDRDERGSTMVPTAENAASTTSSTSKTSPTLTTSSTLTSSSASTEEVNTDSSVTSEPSNSLSAIADGSTSYAAVDLGSNSFHLVISRYEHGEFNVIDRQKDVVRLAGGLDSSGYLSEEAAARALECLHRFGQLLRPIPQNQVRVVGTNALRRMKNKARFLEMAEQALGHSIEIIAGREEARLIYLGVSKWSAMGDEPRLVIDIGGGSTEIIAGRGDVAHCRESLEVGCVVQSNLFFADGKISRKRFNRAIVAAELAIQPVVKEFRLQGWTQVIGCSGTMKSISNVLITGGWSRDGINRESLGRLVEHVISAGHIDQLTMPGLSNERRPVFAGGLSIVAALVELFGIQQMSVSDIALREGVLYDLVGRSSAEDIRDVTVAAMLQKWGVEASHGESVKETAMQLYEQVAPSWTITDNWLKDILGWAAQMHELGLLVSHDSYHNHGAYIVENADMAGFARRDQLLLAALIAGHRRKFPLDKFEDLPSTLVTPAKRLAVLLRLSVLLHRERSVAPPEIPKMEVLGQKLMLKFPAGFLDNNPLTNADLNQEKTWLKSIGVRLYPN